MHSVEWQKWGMNIETISAIGAILLTPLQGWSFIKQGQAIWRKKSGESVPVAMFGYLCFYFMSFAVYGVAMKSVVMLINSMLFLCILPIVFGLIKFKRHTVWECVAYLVFVMMPETMLLSPEKKLLFILFLCGILVFITLPIWEMIRRPARGAIDVRFIIVGMVVNVFWFVFAVTGPGDTPLAIINPIAFAISGITLWMWKRCPDTPKKEVIEVYSGRPTFVCVRARLASDHTFRQEAKTQEAAVQYLLIRLRANGFSGNREDYDVQFGEMLCGTFKPSSR